jgi:trehalose 6-phosphate phosphatase
MSALPAPSLDWCLFLDVDGTLIELTDTPLQTVADAPLKELLRSVAQRLGGALALVSGRSIRYLDELFAPLRLPAAGLHGIERRSASGDLHGANFVDVQLDASRAALGALKQIDPGILIEDKGRTVAVHFRLVPHREALVRSKMSEIARLLGSRYHIQAGSNVFEIKPNGFSKATAIKAFLGEPPFSGRKPVFAGDDLTDQDGFRIVEDAGGASIAVGPRVRAQFSLADAAAVQGWLRGIAALHDPHRE